MSIRPHICLVLAFPSWQLPFASYAFFFQRIVVKIKDDGGFEVHLLFKRYEMTLLTLLQQLDFSPTKAFTQV